MSNLVPLETFRAYFQMHPYHFYQLANTTQVPVTDQCDTVVYQYAWQNLNAAGRQDILTSIEQAEDKLKRYLGFRIAPQYVESLVQWPQFYGSQFLAWNYTDARGEWNSVQLPEGEIRAAGVESLTFVGDAALIYSDSDSDGLDDTFTLTIATTETDSSKIAVYFTDTDRLDGDGPSEEWRIRPVKVSIAGGNATVTGRSWMLVKPVLYQGVVRRVFDPADPSNFVTDLAVYIRTTDPDGTDFDDSQATLIWETSPYPYWGACCGSSNTNAGDPAAVAKALARVGLRDQLHGIVSIGAASYNATDSVWTAINWGLCRPPDRVQVRYLAGVPLVNNNVDPVWSKVVCMLAAAELQRPICACEMLNQKLYFYQFDLARSAGNNDEAYQISAEDLNNPFGTLRGQVYAWKVVQDEYLTRGFLPG